jgi:hypothetical protein
MGAGFVATGSGGETSLSSAMCTLPMGFNLTIFD